MTAPAELEQYILLLLSDSNLPTGGFISSSGLESYIQHGFLHSPTFNSLTTSKSQGLLNYLQSSLINYGKLNLAFLSSTHLIISSLSLPLPPPPSTSFPNTNTNTNKNETRIEEIIKELIEIDNIFESMTLNEVTKKASISQGIALLTLYERAFSSSPSSSLSTSTSTSRSTSSLDDLLPEEEEIEDSGKLKEGEGKELVDRLRALIRNGFMKGHLPIGFGILTSLLGVSLQSAQNLFLFLHARSILSSAIRLNIIGPYESHRLLLFNVRPLVEISLREFKGMRVPRILVSLGGEEGKKERTGREQEEEERPASCWPLGEILAGRHRVLHSKIFNS